MGQIEEFAFSFVGSIPEDPEEGHLYVSTEFATAIHRCACGCGEEVVTPLSPASWSLTYNGDTVSLRPSIGNWGFECRSHYWIRNNRVVWASEWSEAEIEMGREADRVTSQTYFDRRRSEAATAPEGIAPRGYGPQSLWDRIKAWFK